MNGRVPPGFPAPDSMETFQVLGQDGTWRRGHLVVPGDAAEPVPLLLSPHPFGFDPLIILFGHDGGTRTLAALPGLWESAKRHRFAVLSLQSEGRLFTGASLGWRPHLEAYAQALTVVDELNVPVRTDQLIAAGLSMGGMEALLLGVILGRRMQAIAIQNAVIDLAAWKETIGRVIGFEHVPGVISAEVGGEPEEQESMMLARSPVGHLDALWDTPIQVRYSDRDNLVPAESQALRFAGMSPLWTLLEDSPSFTMDSEYGRQAHEYVDWDGLLDFLRERLTPLEQGHVL